MDNLDKLVRLYRSQRKCCRWPYGIFFTLADCAIVASLVMLRETRQDDKLTHYEFKRQLAYQLCFPFVEKRVNVPRLRTSVLQAMELLGIKPKTKIIVAKKHADSKRKKSRCQICPRRVDRKVSTMCSKCKIFICDEHKVSLCANCLE